MSMNVPPLLELNDVSMQFGSIHALTDVNFALSAGEVVGLVGDNGAGKSTLLKIITGYHQQTSGTVRFDGQAVRFRSPAYARSLGIETVYQDLALIDQMSLWRNFFLGKELTWFGGPLPLMKISEMRRLTEQQLREIGLTHIESADQMTAVLSGGERQSLAITRAVFFGARVLLLDEPTAALSVKETRHVFDSIEAARRRGLGIIYIDHNMAHVHPIADRIVVMEHGRVAASLSRGVASMEQLTGFLAKGYKSE
ncbi:MAG TPA: ABC transporter ATP-binding protein [Chloroflexi bacterium]|jgi:simple sugar transport system ATP-binding protein|nr:ABC transporter ATP-binding protein [Chloroflexota bacterium]